jgi:CheY-like chemotaxis protein
MDRFEPAPPSPRPRLRVLVADDSSLSRRISCLQARKCGVDLEEAADGEEAVMWMHTAEFDLVLMDVHMPEMNGLEATRLLRSSGFTVPIIATTGSSSNADIHECLTAGMSAYLPKPFTQPQLEAILLEHLAWTGAPSLA